MGNLQKKLSDCSVGCVSGESYRATLSANEFRPDEHSRVDSSMNQEADYETA